MGNRAMKIGDIEQGIIIPPIKTGGSDRRTKLTLTLMSLKPGECLTIDVEGRRERIQVESRLSYLRKEDSLQFCMRTIERSPDGQEAKVRVWRL